MCRVAAAISLVIACRFDFDPRPDASVADACTFGPFGAPVELAELDSTTDELGPWMSDDRLEIWFSSKRSGSTQLYHSRRTMPTSTFEPPALVDLGIGGTGNDPFVTADRLTLWFVYNPTGASIDDALYIATRASTSDQFASPQPVVELGSAYGQSTPSLTAAELTVAFMSTRPGDPGNGDLYLATRASAMAQFDPPRPIVELNTPGAECCPSLAGDGSSLVYASDVVTPGQQRIVVTARSGGTFQAPRLLDPMLSAPTGVENDPSLSFDGATLVFASTRTGGTGNSDLYVATRSCTQ